MTVTLKTLIMVHHNRKVKQEHDLKQFEGRRLRREEEKREGKGRENEKEEIHCDDCYIPFRSYIEFCG